jgi:hypothetical protein
LTRARRLLYAPLVPDATSPLPPGVVDLDRPAVTWLRRAVVGMLLVGIGTLTLLVLLHTGRALATLGATLHQTPTVAPIALH